MRHEQHRLALLLPDAEQQLLHQRARLVVERAERLVEQQDLRVVGERARHRDALLHAARELLREVALEAGQPDLGDETRGDLGCCAAAMPFSRRPKQMFSRTVSHGNSV